MYKRWNINQDNTTNSRIAWMKRFFSSVENILTELGIKFTSRYTYPNDYENSARDCLCEESNLEKMKSKGYPEWIVNFKSFKTLVNSLDDTWATAQANSCLCCVNYADGFLNFKFNGVDYCFVYTYSPLNTTSIYTHLTLLVNMGDVEWKGFSDSDIKKYKISINSKTEYYDDASYEKNGLITYGTNGYILVEYHKNSYIEMLNFTFNGAEAGDNYYGSGKFLSLGRYNIADGISLRFPSGLACGENVTNEMVNQLHFQTDGEGLFRLLNSIDGDLRTKKYIKGNIYYGLKNNTILGKLDNSITINNYNYPPGTTFIIRGVEYRKIRIPTVHNINFVSKDYSNYGTALSMAFHKEDVVDNESQ